MEQKGYCLRLGVGERKYSMILTEADRVNLNRNSSKGNQLKWFQGKQWYKADYLGYEALSEFVVSELLDKTNVQSFVKYRVVRIRYHQQEFIGCESENFLKEKESIITLAKLFEKYKEMDISKECAHISDVKERIRFVVEHVAAITGLTEFGQYLTRLLEIDAFFLNEDRHLNNVAVVYREEEGCFDYCPVFDNGAALFSDATISYPMNQKLEKCLSMIEAKPFSRLFDEQVVAAEELYGIQLQLRFDAKDVERLAEQGMEFYAEEIVCRIQDVLRHQMRKYEYLRK